MSANPPRIKAPALATGYSYLRFSSDEQAHGDSIRRQTEARDRWLAANPHVKLDTTLNMIDAGKTAFGRTDLKGYALGAFVELVAAGKIAKGSYLILESLDRLSREHVQKALRLLLGLLDDGIKVVQLLPTTMVYDQDSDTMPLMVAMMELARGRSESLVKSQRLLAVWQKKRASAATTVITASVPNWIRAEDRERRGNLVTGGKLVLIADRAAIVRKMFRLSLTGVGSNTIAQTLNREGVPTFGRQTYKGKSVTGWSKTVVQLILTNRACVGEFQPCEQRGKARIPSGDPISDYFPRVVTDTTFNAVQAGIASRQRSGGRKGTHVNLFAGIISMSPNKQSLVYRHKPGKASSLVLASIISGSGAAWVSFPSQPLEDAIISQLREVQVGELFPIVEDDPIIMVQSLTHQLTEVTKSVAVWTNKMDTADADLASIIMTKLTELNATKKRLALELATAEQAIASPAVTALNELKSAVGFLDGDNSNAVRERLKVAVRKTITSVECSFDKNDEHRFAHVIVRFVTGTTRQYLIVVQGPTGQHRRKRTPGSWHCRSLSFPALVRTADADRADRVALLARLAAAIADLSSDEPAPIPAGCTTGLIP